MPNLSVLLLPFYHAAASFLLLRGVPVRTAWGSAWVSSRFGIFGVFFVVMVSLKYYASAFLLFFRGNSAFAALYAASIAELRFGCFAARCVSPSLVRFRSCHRQLALSDVIITVAVRAPLRLLILPAGPDVVAVVAAIDRHVFID